MVERVDDVRAVPMRGRVDEGGREVVLVVFELKVDHRRKEGKSLETHSCRLPPGSSEPKTVEEEVVVVFVDD